MRMRKEGALATFLMTTLLLPSLLVAPVERDIRIISVVNPFYAAAKGKAVTNPRLQASLTEPTIMAEGARALRSVILMRHLQRILDALPAAQVPKTESASSAVPVVSQDQQKSNIVCVTVSGGISRTDTVYPMFGVEESIARRVLYVLPCCYALRVNTNVCSIQGTSSHNLSSASSPEHPTPPSKPSCTLSSSPPHSNLAHPTPTPPPIPQHLPPPLSLPPPLQILHQPPNPLPAAPKPRSSNPVPSTQIVQSSRSVYPSSRKMKMPRTSCRSFATR